MSFVSPDGAHIITPWRSDLATLVPHAKTLDYQGDKMLVMPNQQAEAKVARNLGVAIPPPILTRYAWWPRSKRKPWDIQRTTAALLSESARAYVLSTMGTGKTSAALFAADWLLQQGIIKHVVISSPLSTLTNVWEAEIFGWFPHLTQRVLYGDKKRRMSRLAEDARVYIVNHHGVPLLAEQLAERARNEPIAFIIDELAILRNKGTTLWKAHNTVANLSAYVWGLTGSPTPIAPTDAWAQIKLLTPANTTKTFGAFCDLTMKQVTAFKWVPRHDANTTVHRSMQPSVRFTRDDIAQLPPVTYTDFEVPLEPKAAKAYKLLFDKMRVTTHNGRDITAVNEGVLQSKLLQVSAGYVYTDAVGGKKEVFTLPNQSRLDELEQIVSQSDGKIIVFVPFVHALKGITEHLQKNHHDVAMVHGGVSRGRRDMIFKGFQHGTSPRVIVAHPQCMAHGLTLTAANTVVWFSPTQSLEIYEQANARVDRPGQTRKVLVAHLFGTPVERAVYARLKARGRMQGLLLALFKQQELTF